MTVKRIAAWVGIIALVALYLVTLVLSFLKSPVAQTLFKVSLVCTILIPAMIWIFIWIYGRMSGKKTIADLHMMQKENEDDIS